MQTTHELASSKLSQIYLCSAATHAGKKKETNNETELGHLVKVLRAVISGRAKKTPQDTTSLSILAFPGWEQVTSSDIFLGIAKREETRQHSQM